MSCLRSPFSFLFLPCFSFFDIPPFRLSIGRFFILFCAMAYHRHIFLCKSPTFQRFPVVFLVGCMHPKLHRRRTSIIRIWIFRQRNMLYVFFWRRGKTQRLILRFRFPKNIMRMPRRQRAIVHPKLIFRRIFTRWLFLPCHYNSQRFCFLLRKKR